MKPNLLFLDRDGVLILDRDYGELGDPFKIKFLEGVFEGLKILKEKRFHFFVFTNQSGIQRGYYGEKNVIKIHERIDQFLYEKGIKIFEYYFCPHLPDEGCSCRKPNLGLYRKWIKEFPFQYDKKFMIGDKDSDVEFGKKLGFKTIFIEGRYERNSNPDFIAKNFKQAVDFICSFF